jgi:hypothetical protein
VKSHNRSNDQPILLSHWFSETNFPFDNLARELLHGVSINVTQREEKKNATQLFIPIGARSL